MLFNGTFFSGIAAVHLFQTVTCLNPLQTVRQHRYSALHSDNIRVVYPTVGLTAEGINNGRENPCIMNKETMPLVLELVFCRMFIQ